MNELLTIGRFARLAGLSVGALRHYDDLDLLRPARVDPASGYRLYRRDHLEAARTIVRLRDLEVPLETIRDLLATDDPVRQRALLRDHRARLEARTSRLQRVLHVLGQLNSTEADPMTAPTTTADLDPTTRRKLAADLFNHTWTLLETERRTPGQDDDMLHAAHASRFHWGEVGEPVHLPEGYGNARVSTASWGAPNRRCGTPTAASRSTRRTALPTSTSPRPTRPWRARI